MSNGVGAIFSFQLDYGGGVAESHQAYWGQGLLPGSPLFGRHYQQRWPGSFDGGNVLIAGALNALEAFEAGKGPNKGGYNVTHLVYMHNDVVPEAGWLDKLICEQLETEADMLSVVMAIKDMDGKSSCAIDDQPYEVMRRIMMQEVYDLPETFCAEDCGYPAGSLLVNHGLCVFDFTKPWWRETHEFDDYKALLKHGTDLFGSVAEAEDKTAWWQKVALAVWEGRISAPNEPGTLKLRFTSPDRIKRKPTDADGKIGIWEAQHSPSDWHISRELNRRGAKVLATRKINCSHYGMIPFGNHSWGQHSVDPALKHKFNGVPIRNEAYCLERDRLAKEKEEADGRAKETTTGPTPAELGEIDTAA